jgi:hypothetical protein
MNTILQWLSVWLLLNAMLVVLRIPAENVRAASDEENEL